MIARLTDRVVAESDLESVDDILAALTWCVKNDTPASCDAIVDRLLDPGVATPRYIEQVLFPLLPKLSVWAVEHKRDVDGAIQTITGMWMKNVLGKVDITVASQLSALAETWTCECGTCLIARSFIANPKRAHLRVAYGGASSPQREHVEDAVAKHAYGLITVEWPPRRRPEWLYVRRIFLASHSVGTCR